ncbi:FAD-binding oxidoreductase [Sulfitobacter sp. MF3-043]|uniref:FAD-binding oxidoreductase n=1 Tax=Sulfitobacter sediminivivens TaxID=3252902 RepID=UPI0036DCED00
MKNWTRRAALLGSGAVLGALGYRGLASHNPTLDGAGSTATANPPGTLNDASLLSQTSVHKHIILKDDPGETLVAALRAEIKEARENGRPVNVSAARHSMGGQAIPLDGHAITFDNGLIEPDTSQGTYRAHAGARWAQVIKAIDPIGYSPKVMQSNNDFGVAATFCVNAHGWPVPFGPMGSTVKSIDLITPDGSLVTCSRTENSTLFDQSMGGYGLTGAIVSMVVEMEQNTRLKPSFTEMPAEDFGTAFIQALADPEVTMAYGRLNVSRAEFFKHALMITYRATDDQSDLPAASGSGTMSKIASYVYRAQLGNERMKDLRWWFETDLGTSLGGGETTRNSLINEPVITLDDRDDTRTDILHEYFVAPDRFPDFLTLCRDVIPSSYQEFLNVTLRFINTDKESWLSYATVPRIAAVMSFSQEMTARAEADMARMTRDLVDGIIAIGGAYYLPYRPHPTVAQLERAYPRAAAFAAAKRALDPDMIFRNNLWDSYLEQL